ncbi:MAG TPA: DUF2079 domain-containing protein [Ktedonobacterales bacterium]|nr:DUF2079 domain-containing protein [Ktedonobacterales bacterium]
MAITGEALPRGALDREGAATLWRWLRALGVLLITPYRELPPAPRGRWTRIATALVTLMALAFVIYFTAYTWSAFDAFLSNAEDMGIMDQALWNTLHGAVLHQTICNSISDTNCLGDVSRFAIHFEPIMLPLSLLYLLAPTPKALMLLQAVIVASGAYPVFWIACRRLSSPLAGLIFAAGYLLYPALQSAVMFDFHAVTLSMAFLLFAVYFALTRNNVGLVVACVLALSTKEEVPLDVLMLGLAIFAFQRRRKMGLGLILLSLTWLVMALVVMRHVSPVGHSPTATRYGYLGEDPAQAALYLASHPIQLLRDQMFANGGFEYLNRLLGAFSFLGLASPLTLVLCLPALMINLLSSSQSMHIGAHQYSAEIVPFMVFSAISGIAILWRASALFQPHASLALNRLSYLAKRAGVRASRLRLPALSAMQASRVILVVLLALTFGGIVVQQRLVNLTNLRQVTFWAGPTATAHSDLADSVVALIPADASVSAQNTLVPHLSQRRYIYQYPYGVDQAEYVVLDTKGYIYPFASQDDYNRSVQALLASGQFTTIFDMDGYLVLWRNTG